MCPRWKTALPIMIRMDRDSKLLEIVLALAAASRLPGGLDRRQQQANQDANNRNHYEKLDQGETEPPVQSLLILDQPIKGRDNQISLLAVNDLRILIHTTRPPKPLPPARRIRGLINRPSNPPTTINIPEAGSGTLAK